MTGRDVGRLARVHAASFEGGDTWNAASLSILLDMPGTFARLSPGEDGMAVFRVAADEAELLTLAVLPAARRKGVGRALLSQVARASHDLGAVRLFLEVSATNTAARSLYERSGFVEVARRRRYYADGSDALVMAAPLGPACGSAAG